MLQPQCQFHARDGCLKSGQSLDHMRSKTAWNLASKEGACHNMHFSYHSWHRFCAAAAPPCWTTSRAGHDRCIDMNPTVVPGGRVRAFFESSRPLGKLESTITMAP